MKGIKVLEEILKIFPSINPAYAYEAGIKGIIPNPEIAEFNKIPYLIIPDPALSNNDSRYGLAVRVDGDVKQLKTIMIDIKTGRQMDEENIDYEILDYDSIDYDFAELNDEKTAQLTCLDGGRTHLAVFAEEYDNNIINKAVISLDKHSCWGMVYEISSENEMTQIKNVKDVNMAINAISNYQLQCVNGGGLFNINRFMIEAYNNLCKKGFGLKTERIKSLITDNLADGINEFIESYTINNNVPLDSIILKIMDLGSINHCVIGNILKKNESFTQSAYNLLLSKGLLDDFIKLNEWSKIKPDESVIQSSYNSLFSKGNIGYARDLMEWSKIEPVFEKSAVHSGYKFLFSKGWLESARDLIEWSGIKPNESSIQSGYDSLLNNDFISYARDLMKWSKIKPNESAIQSGYKFLLSRGLIGDAKKVLKWAKIKPDKKIIQSSYDSLLGKNWIYDAHKLMNWSSIKPSKEVLEKYDIQKLSLFAKINKKNK